LYCDDYSDGLVSRSSRSSQAIASSRDPPHISAEGCKLAQKAGRSGRPKNAQRSSSVSCTQRTPAGLPSGMPGKGVLIEGAMQQAAQLGRQIITAAPYQKRLSREGRTGFSWTKL
jgi:hypothetical protein